MRSERPLGVAGAILGGLALATILAWPQPGLHGWLAATVVLSSVPAGALCLLMMMRLIPGAWGEELRVACEAGTLLTPLAAAAFLPVLASVAAIYPWASPLFHPTSAFQAAWLSPGSFALRTFLWFAMLGGLAGAMLGRRSQTLVACIGLVLFPLVGSAVAVDWLMSLDPGFASSGFGLQVLSIELTVAFAALLILRLTMPPPPRRLGVLGGLLLTLLLIWAYLQFLPFVITWSGNLPSGVGWYALRATEAWRIILWVAAALGGIPLVLLLFPKPRAGRSWLLWLSAAVLAGMATEVAWYALPPLGWRAGLSFLLALASFGCLAAGGLRLAFERRVRMRAPTPREVPA